MLFYKAFFDTRDCLVLLFIFFDDGQPREREIHKAEHPYHSMTAAQTIPPTTEMNTK